MNSRLILALDFHKVEPGEILSELEGLAVGVKVGFPLALEVGWGGLRSLVREFPDYYWIADFKLADIPDVTSHVLSKFADWGFDAAIIHLFTGHRRYEGIDVIGVAGMSHPESHIVRGNFTKLLDQAYLLKVMGIVVGATRQEMIREARKRLPEALIFSPGVGFQGAKPGEALKAGADFEIVGRSITLSEDPRGAAEQVVEMERESL